MKNCKPNDIVKCTNISKNNVEKLKLDKLYRVIGATNLGGDVIFTLRSDDGELRYATGNFLTILATEVGMPEAFDSRDSIIDLNTVKASGKYSAPRMTTMPPIGVADVNEKFMPLAKFDIVDKPKHYNSYEGFEVIDVIEQVTKELKGIEAVTIGNVVKYVLRYQFKNGVEDLKKAEFYLKKAIIVLEKRNDKEMK